MFPAHHGQEVGHDVHDFRHLEKDENLGYNVGQQTQFNLERRRSVLDAR